MNTFLMFLNFGCLGYAISALVIFLLPDFSRCWLISLIFEGSAVEPYHTPNVFVHPNTGLFPMGDPKYVFAHFMVGNTYSYEPRNFAKDVKDAIAIGIDGFALNLGRDEWTFSRIEMVFSVVENFPSFKLFFSFDMSSITSAMLIRSYIERYARHRNSFTYRGKYFVSTFAGEDQTFGRSDVDSGWNLEIKIPLKEKGIDILLVPSWTAVDAWQLFKRFPSIDGAFSWAAWYAV
jgi:glucan endo-1,3-alpha-glucosidase